MNVLELESIRTKSIPKLGVDTSYFVKVDSYDDTSYIETIEWYAENIRFYLTFIDSYIGYFLGSKSSFPRESREVYKLFLNSLERQTAKELCDPILIMHLNHLVDLAISRSDPIPTLHNLIAMFPKNLLSVEDNNVGIPFRLSKSIHLRPLKKIVRTKRVGIGEIRIGGKGVVYLDSDGDQFLTYAEGKIDTSIDSEVTSYSHLNRAEIDILPVTEYRSIDLTDGSVDVSHISGKEIQSSLDSHLQILKQDWQEGFSHIRNFCHVVSVLSYENGYNSSATLTRVPFAFSFSWHREDMLQVQETFIHETLHTKLNLMLLDRGLCMNPLQDKKYYHPWAKSPRPMRSLFVAGHAFLGMLEFYGRLLNQGACDSTVETRFERYSSYLSLTIDAIKKDAVLTKDGHIFLEGMESRRNEFYL